MKRIISIWFMFLLMFAACQDGLEEQGSMEHSDKVSIRLLIDLPQFTVVTRAGEDVENYQYVSLLNFDENDEYLATVTVSYKPERITADVLKNTRRIHLILHKEADCPVILNKGEKADVLTTKGVTCKIAWGETGKLSNLNSEISPVTLYRNFVRVKVSSYVSNFALGGFLLGNYATTGTVATISKDLVNLPSDVQYANQSILSKEPVLYMFEARNTNDAPTFVIIQKQGAEEFYKVHLLDKEKVPYPLLRNYSYNIVINGYTSEAGGSSSIENALLAPPANNLYAEVIKESPVISTPEGEKLEIKGNMVNLLTNGGNLSIRAEYTDKNGDVDNSQIAAKTLSDVNDILTNLTMVNGEMMVQVKPVTEGPPLKAEVSISKGALTRVVTIISSKEYSFNSSSTDFTYNSLEDLFTLDFTIPEDYPEALLPIECEIKTKYLHPISDKDVLVVRDGMDYKYVYIAREAKNYQLTFRPSYDWCSDGEALILHNPYFQDVTVQIKGPGQGDIPKPPMDMLQIDLLRLFYKGYKIGDASFLIDGFRYYWANNGANFFQMETDSKSNSCVLKNNNMSGLEIDLSKWEGWAKAFIVDPNKDDYIYVRIWMQKWTEKYVFVEDQFFYAKFSKNDIKADNSVDLNLSIVDDDNYWK